MHHLILAAATATPGFDEVNAILSRAQLSLLGALGGGVLLVVIYAGMRYLFSFGGIHGVEAAKGALKHGAIGLGVGSLAPLIVTVLRWVITGSPA
ncbi:MAG TPA: hypothetical protein VET24_09790 [Actinomycetota bacterium]|nr:hypothetical protein [Actinomycetota bacterium]